MRVEGGIASCSRQLLFVLVGYMPACRRVFVPLRKTEVDDEDNVLELASADEEVVWFYISMKKT